MKERRNSYSAVARADLTLAVVGLIIGFVLLFGSVGVLVYRACLYRKGFVEGRFSDREIESMRQRILQTSPNTEGLQKIADYVFRRLSADAVVIKDFWSAISGDLIIFSIIGGVIIYLSIRLKRNTKMLASIEEPQKDPTLERN